MKEQRNPVVTVVMPSLNVGPYIRECLESVLAQTLKDLEVICVDAGSTDGTLETIRELAARDSRIRLIMSDKRSYGRQMNLGIEAARGKYLGIVETDDAVLPDMYRRLAEIAEESQADIVRADYYRFTGTLETGERELLPCTPNPDLYGKTVCPAEDRRAFQFTINCGNLYSLGFLRANGIRFNETPGASYQDLGFYFQTSVFASRIHFLNEPFYLYRRDNPNSSINDRGKVYAVCEEYAFIRSRLVGRVSSYREFKTDYGRDLFFAYQSSLHRIAEEYRAEFIERFSRDLKAAYLRGEVVRDAFGKENWRRILQIMTMPLAFVDLTFGPTVHESEPELVVSLTTYPKRMPLVYKAIDSLLLQDPRPDHVVLYLAEEEFPTHELPHDLELRLAREPRFEVRYVENLRSHKKYYYVFRDFPGANVVLVDDDLVYPPNMLRALLVQYRRTPHAVICCRAHTVAMSKEGGYRPYLDWMRSRKIIGRPSPLVISTTGWGTLIPAGALPDSAFNWDLIRKTALKADDLWLKWQQLLAGYPSVFIDLQPQASPIPGTQGESLFHDNVDGGGNDKVWESIQATHSVEAKVLAKLLCECYRHEFPAEFAPRISWVVRKLLGGRLCLAENGLRYTFFHLFEKAFGKCNEIARKLSRPKGWQSPHRPPTRRMSSKSSVVPSVPAVAPIKVSVIVPVYNAADYLQQCLDSVLAQTIQSLEILCVDDGSTDSSLDILRECAVRDRRVVVLAQRNAGASVARNLALSYARGEFVAFLDPDDYYPDPTSLQKLYDAARRQNVPSACGYLERFDPKTPDIVERPTRYRRPTGVYTYANNPFDFGYQLHIFNRRMLKDAGIAFPVVSRYQDPLFLVRALFAAKRFCAVDVPAYRYRLGHQQINWAKDDWRKARDMMRIMSDIVDFARQNGLTALIERTRNRIENDYRELFSGDSGRILSSSAEYERLRSVLDLPNLATGCK